MYKRVLVTLVLLLLLLSASAPFSVVELCHRPQDVFTTERHYDVATNTYIQAVATERSCDPPNFPEEPGTVFIRLQWRKP